MNFFHCDVILDNICHSYWYLIWCIDYSTMQGCISVPVHPPIFLHLPSLHHLLFTALIDMLIFIMLKQHSFPLLPGVVLTFLKPPCQIVIACCPHWPHVSFLRWAPWPPWRVLGLASVVGISRWSFCWSTYPCFSLVGANSCHVAVALVPPFTWHGADFLKPPCWIVIVCCLHWPHVSFLRWAPQPPWQVLGLVLVAGFSRWVSWVSDNSITQGSMRGDGSHKGERQGPDLSAQGSLVWNEDIVYCKSCPWID